MAASLRGQTHVVFHSSWPYQTSCVCAFTSLLQKEETEAAFRCVCKAKSGDLLRVSLSFEMLKKCSVVGELRSVGEDSRGDDHIDPSLLTLLAPVSFRPDWPAAMH